MLNSIPTSAVVKFLSTEGLAVPADIAHASALAVARKVAGSNSQAKFAALLINLTEGDISNEQLTSALAVEFPEAKVGDRHGPHYASLSRSGKLAGCRFAVGKAGRSSTGATNELATLKGVLESIREAKSIKDVREILNALDNG